MGRQFNKPSEQDFSDLNSITRMIGGEQLRSEGGNRTTYSITGSPQYVATTYTVSDILQGAVGFRDPNETRILLNQGLSAHLENLYGLGIDGVSTFSTSAPAPALTSGGTGGGAYGGSDPNAFGPGGTIRQEWVETLPSKHSNGALLWATKGKGSREMHLPTSEDINQDIAQHKQVAGLPDKWRHPWNMDRDASYGKAFDTKPTVNAQGYVDYWEGGESIVGSSGQTIGNEDPSKAGVPGAFGYLSPEEEQFYISMAWPYKGDVYKRFEKANRPDIAEISKTLSKDQYRGKKILVFCVETQKACVCTPGDWGPNPYYSNGATAKDSIEGSYFGLSPDTHHVLGSDHGKNFIVGFVPDDTPLGPYIPRSPEQGFMNTSADGSGASGQFVNTPAEMRYAGQKIINHPNNLLDANTVFLSGFYVDNRAVNDCVTKDIENPGKGFLMPALLNWLWYCMEAGFIFGGYLGSYGYKNKTFNQDELSNHAKGGAIDIGRLGHVSMGNGATVSLGDLAACRPVMDKLIDFMATLPVSIRPEEIGGPYRTPAGAPLKVYLDPAHIHFGFDTYQVGKLIPALLPPQGYSNAL